MKILLLLLAINFIADQLLQSPTIMNNKHRDSMLLFAHVLIWSISVFLFATTVLLRTGNIEVFNWWLCVTIIHFAVEWCCLRMWTYHYNANKMAFMVLWIMLEQLVINSAMALLFVYFMER